MAKALDHLRRFAATPAGEVVLVLLVLLIGTVMRFYRLGHESLWGDEYYTWLIGSLPTAGDVLTKVTVDEPHPPLLFLLYHYFLRFLPEGDFWLRLPAAMAGVGALPLLYAAVRPWGRRLALVAMVLLMISPMHVWYSQEARAGSFKVLLELVVLVTVVAAVMGTEARWRLAWQLAAVAGCGVGLQLHFFFVFIGSAALLVFLLDVWSRREFKAMALVPPVLLFVLLLYTTIRATTSWGLVLAWMPERYGPDMLLDVIRAQAQGPLWSPLPNWLSWAAMVPWLVLMTAGVVACWRHDRRLGLVLGAFLFFCLALPVLISFVRPLVFYGQRHLVIATPIVAAVIAAGVVRWRWLWLCLVPVLVFQFVYLDGTWRHRQKHNYEGAIRLVEQQGTPGDAVIVVPTRLVGVVERYAEASRPFHGADSHEQAALLGMDPSRPFWVISFQDSRPTMAEAFPGAVLDVGLVETYRPGQELFVVRVNAPD